MWTSGAGDPNVALVPGTIGDLYSNTAGGVGTALWVFGRHTGARSRLSHVGLALVLLVAYALYLLFQLKTHPDEFAGQPGVDLRGHVPDLESLLDLELASCAGSLLAQFWMVIVQHLQHALLPGIIS